VSRRLRIAHLIVTPVLVWDDGEELSAGPTLNPVTVPLSRVPELVASLPGEVAGLAVQLAGGEAVETPTDEVPA
jgi:hypothetical protein